MNIRLYCIGLLFIFCTYSSSNIFYSQTDLLSHDQQSSETKAEYEVPIFSFISSLAFFFTWLQRHLNKPSIIKKPKFQEV
jgi:hypothetical protein